MKHKIIHQYHKRLGYRLGMMIFRVEGGAATLAEIAEDMEAAAYSMETLH